MLTKTESVQLKLHCITIEDLVPENHLLRKIEQLVDFSFVYPLVKDLYCKNNGKPSTDPVVLVKYLLLGYLFGIPSERRIEKELEVNVAYRWFLGLDLFDSVPHHSTISQNRKRRFNGTSLFRSLFEHILFQCMEKGLVKGKLILTDSTHIKAHTSKASKIKILVEKESADYIKRLDYYEDRERKELELKGMKPKRNRASTTPKAKIVEKTISTTDPEAGYMKRGNKPLGMHYLNHQSTDSKYGMIVDVAVTPGNVRDSTPYIDRIRYMKEKIQLPIKAVGVDSAYDTSLIHQVLSEQNISVYTPLTNHGGKTKVEFAKEEFTYKNETDTFICPNNKAVAFRNLDRTESNVVKVYRANTKDCKICLLKEKCLAPSKKCREIKVNIFNNTVAKSRRLAKTKLHTDILNLRQIWCEGNFANQKWGHNLARFLRRGLEAAEDHCLLSATAFNLKRMIKCIG